MSIKVIRKILVLRCARIQAMRRPMAAILDTTIPDHAGGIIIGGIIHIRHGSKVRHRIYRSMGPGIRLVSPKAKDRMEDTRKHPIFFW